MSDDSPLEVTLEGECLCGEVRYRAQGSHNAMYLCHCSRCRKETGSIHAANIFLKDARLTWLRGEWAVRHYALPNTRKARAFCATCGSPLPRVAAAVAGTVVVPAGGLESELPFEATAHIFTDSRAHWEDKLAQVTRRAEFAK